MRPRTLTAAIVTALIATVLPLSLSAPANAERVVRSDPVDDSSDGDISQVVVRHQRRVVVIAVSFVDNADPEEMWLRVDRPAGNGWDWNMAAGMYYPKWYSIWERGDLDGDPKCSLKKRTTTEHTIRMTVPRRCFDKPNKIRVRVSWSDDDVQFGDHDSTGWTDWARRG